MPHAIEGFFLVSSSEQWKQDYTLNAYQAFKVFPAGTIELT